MVVLHGLGYEQLEKSEIRVFWPISLWGFFHPWANCAARARASTQFAQKAKFWKQPHISRNKNAPNENDPSFERFLNDKSNKIKKIISF